MGNVAEPELLEGGVRYTAFQEDNYSTGYEAEELGTTSNGDAFGISTGGGVQNQKANKKGEGEMQMEKRKWEGKENQKDKGRRVVVNIRDRDKEVIDGSKYKINFHDSTLLSRIGKLP